MFALIAVSFVKAISEPVVIALIVAVTTLIVALVNLFYTRDLKININSRMDEYLETVRVIAHAAGVKEEKERGDP